MPRFSVPAQAGDAVPADERQIFVTVIGSGPAGARLVTSPDSALVVGVAPIAELGLLLGRPVFKSRPLTYLMHASAGRDLPWAELKIGESLDPKGRIATHYRDPPVPADEVILLGSYHDGFGKDGILALQHAVTAQAIRAGRCRVVGATPQTSWLQKHNAAQLGRWLFELRPMLVAGGCTLLEPPGLRLHLRVEVLPDVEAVVPEPIAEPVQAVVSGYRLDLPAGLLLRPDTKRYVLTLGAVHAEAVEVGGWTILRRGSLVARRDTSGIQLCLARKRNTLVQAEVLKTAGQRDLLLAMKDVALPSLTNAGRLVTGSNEPGSIWRAA